MADPLRIRSRVWLAPLAVPLLLLGGCASPLDDDLWQTAEVARLEAEVRRLEAAPIGRDDASGAADEVATPTGLDGYIALALDRNPRLAAAESRVLRLAARIPQVSSLDDPMLMIAPIGEMAETAAGEVLVMTSITQKLPFPGKLSARERVALREMAAAVADLQQSRLEVVGDVRRAYWGLYLATRAVEVTRQNMELLDQLRDVAEAQYSAGRVPQQDVLRASVEISNLHSELAVLDQRLTTSRAMLNQLMNRPASAPIPAPKPTSLDEVDLALDGLLAEAAQGNPQIEQARQQVAAAHERLTLAKLQKYPDFSVGANYNFVDDDGLAVMANGQDQWWLSFGLNLPIWFEKYEAAEVEALRGVAEQSAQLEAAQNRVSFRVTDALARVTAQREVVRLLEERIIPEAEQTLEVSQSAYRAGNAGFITLIDNWRQLLRLKLMRYQAMSQYQQNLADLEEAVGRKVSAQQSPAEQNAVDMEPDADVNTLE